MCFFQAKMPQIITSHDVFEPLKQVRVASRDVIIFSQICRSNEQRGFFTLGDGCSLPNVAHLSLHRLTLLGAHDCTFELVVSHYSAIGDTISCDAPYSAIGFRGKSYPPLLGLSLDCDRPLLRTEVSEPKKNYQYSTEGQKLHENSAPVLVIISGHSLVFSRKIITSTGFYRYCAADASAPVVVINQSPRSGV